MLHAMYSRHCSTIWQRGCAPDVCIICMLEFSILYAALAYPIHCYCRLLSECIPYYTRHQCHTHQQTHQNPPPPEGRGGSSLQKNNFRIAPTIGIRWKFTQEWTFIFAFHRIFLLCWYCCCCVHSGGKDCTRCVFVCRKNVCLSCEDYEERQCNVLRRIRLC